MAAEEKRLSELSNETLLKEGKNRKALFLFICVIVAFMIGVGIYGTSKNGTDFYTFLPIVFAGIAVVFWTNYNNVKKEIKHRGLE